MCFPDIPRPDSCGKTINGGVGFFDEFIHILEGEHGKHWSENLFLRDAHGSIHRIEDGWFYEAAAVPDASAFQNGVCSFFLADPHILENAFHLSFRDERSQARFRIERIAGCEFARPVEKFVHYRAMNAFLDEQAGTGVADFAFAVKDAVECAFHGSVDVRVGK